MKMKEAPVNGEYNLRRRTYFVREHDDSGEEYDFSSPPSSPARTMSLTTPPLLVRKQHYQVITSVDFGDLPFPQLPSEAMQSSVENHRRMNTWNFCKRNTLKMRPWGKSNHVLHPYHFSNHDENMNTENGKVPVSKMIHVDGEPCEMHSMGSTFLRQRPRTTNNNQEATSLFSVVDDMCCRWSNTTTIEEGTGKHSAFENVQPMKGDTLC